MGVYIDRCITGITAGRTCCTTGTVSSIKYKIQIRTGDELRETSND